LLHAGLETATLDHEVVDYAMEDGVRVKTAVYVFEEILDGNGCFVGIQLQCNCALIGMQFDHGLFAFSWRSLG